MKVQELMTANPACVTPGDTLRDAARLMQEHDTGALPVVEDQRSRRLVAMVTDRDVAIRGVAQGRGPDTPVRDVMTDGPDAVRAEDDAKRVLEIMKQRQVRRVPVVDENGGVIGIVSQADVATVERAASDREVGRVVEQISQPGGGGKR